ncbi:MAG: TIR domain-containing protein [Methyloceanibacter sp.]|nr:TIR domain-containing protein [Methyloceanibacter sp.]
MPEASAAYSAFISYAKADHKKAHEIAASLEERGFKCWIAPRDVRAGRPYGDEIIRGIERSRCFILVLSAASNDSAFVAREVERAVSKKKPVFPVRVDNVEPAPSLELFISGTQWIDAFAGRLSSHMDHLAAMLADDGAEDGQLEAGKDRPDPRRLAKWALPAGAAAAVLLAIGAGIVLWPVHNQVPHDTEVSDPSLVAKQVAAAQPRGNGEEMIAGGNVQQGMGRALGLQDVGDSDFQACEKASGDAGMAACDRAIASGKFTGRNLSYLYNDRGFLSMQKGELDQALVDLDEAIRIDASNLFAFWNRGAVYGAKDDFERARDDFGKALALNPDTATKAKIEEALTAMNDSVARNSDPSVISDPSAFWGHGEEGSASASSNYPAAMPAAPSTEAMPALPESPPPIPTR